MMKTGKATTAFHANLWKMYLFRFFVSLHFIGGVLVPFFTDWAGLTLTQVLILQSWFMLCILLLEVPSGAFADFVGRKQSLILACGVNAAAAWVYASRPDFSIFMLGEALFALSAALLSGASEAFIYDTLEEISESDKSKRVFGRISSLGLAGIMVAAPIGSVLGAELGLRMPMLLLVVPFTVAFAIALTFKEPARTRKTGQYSYAALLRDGVTHFIKHRVLRILALDMIVIATIAYFLIWFYQPMLKQAGVDVAYFGIVHAAFAGSQILVMTNYGRLERIFGSKRRLIMISSAITGITFIIGGLTTFLPVVLLVIIVGGGFGLSRRPLFVSCMNKYLPSSSRATALSTVSMLRTLALIVINPVVGVLADWSLSNTLVILGVIAIVFSLISRVEESHLID
ncbi:MAG: MFS transporter [Candidatus Bathyarchaeota archaeon]|nr:MAG: MFS transporter [Candidatus Bathyarchaeota archaeon]